MSRNIVICCDGTGNKVTINQNSNVVHLFGCLEKNDKQVCYYSPGLGTVTPIWKEGKVEKLTHILKDLVGGYSLKKNVLEGYSFLMDNYSSGDDIYLFGFSRGAYTVRVIAGFIEMFGLLQKGNYSHAEELFQLLEKFKGRFEVPARIKRSMSRPVKIKFMGIWDSVSAIGSVIRSRRSMPYTDKLGAVQTIRHAVAIDEKRRKFEYQSVSGSHNDLKEVFFAGVHSDVGGTYKEEGLSKIALVWMLGEARQKGLILSSMEINHYVLGLGNSPFKGPNTLQPIHNSFKFFYWFINPFPRRRKIEAGSLIHHSVVSKKIKDKRYNPRNLNDLHLKNMRIENDVLNVANSI